MNQTAVTWSQPTPSRSAIESLVQEGRVHSRVYTDQAIFDLELERIFHTAWVYIGHDSEVPKIGDYQRRQMGRTPVVMVRGKDKQVRVLINRCRHRGAMVVETECGNTKLLRCWYHGWVYDLDGSLREVPEPGGYGPDFKCEKMGLSQAPRVASHRGFIFCNRRASH